MAASPALAKHHPPPWLFGVLCLPMGVYWGYITTAMPYLLRKQGLSLDSIATISSSAAVVQVLYFLWSPFIDMGLSRRAWFLLLNLAAAATLTAVLLLPATHFLLLYTVLLTAGNAISNSANAAAGGLMAVLMPDSARGKTGGWYQAGNLGGAAAAGGVCIWLAESFPPTVVAVVTAAMVALPALSILAVKEPPREYWFDNALLRRNLQNLWAVRKQGSFWLGLAFFLAPVGAGAAGNLFSGVGSDYNAPTSTVIWATGFGAALFTVAGCIIGGYLCDRINRWNGYILCGLPSPASAAAMLLLHHSPAVFAAGALSYAFGNGMAFAAFNALALQLVGDEPHTAGTRFTFFCAAANAPIAYVTWLDGQGARVWGVNGLLGVDVASTMAGIIGLGFLLRFSFSKNRA